MSRSKTDYQLAKETAGMKDIMKKPLIISVLSINSFRRWLSEFANDNDKQFQTKKLSETSITVFRIK